MENGNLKCKKTRIKKVHSLPIRKIEYSSTLFGFRDIRGDGKFVRISIIDSGLPLHKDIKTDTFKAQNFTSSGSIYDVFGHSTAIAGIIAANGSSGIKGLAPESDLYFAKALDDGDGNGGYDSVINAILWSISREVDIILMSFGSSVEHSGLKDAIKKAGNLGISMFAAGGSCINRTKDVDFPARYDEVFSIGFSNNINKNEVIQENKKTKGVILSFSNFETTFINNKFATMSGSSLCAAAVAGIGILAFQRLRREGFNVKNSQILYNEIGRLAVME